MKTIDYEFSRLCDEIDYWRSQAERWEKECKKAQRAHCKTMNSSIANSKEQIGIILTAALDPDSIINRGHKHALEEQLGKSQKQLATRKGSHA